MMKVEILWMNGLSVVEAVFMNVVFEVERRSYR